LEVLIKGADNFTMRGAFFSQAPCFLYTQGAPSLDNGVENNLRAAAFTYITHAAKKILLAPCAAFSLLVFTCSGDGINLIYHCSGWLINFSG